MNVTDIQNILTLHGLRSPDLEMLRPTAGRYQCLLLQPKGPIYADDQRIGNFDETDAAVRGLEFLKLAKQRGAHLAITPEYFLPWSCLQEAIQNEFLPQADSLWVLGCQSIQPQELSEFTDAVAGNCLVLHESLAGMRADRVLLDPAVLVFRAIRNDGTTQLVAVVQFKTFPSRDNVFYEEGVLKQGTDVYKIRGTTGHLSVSTVICSDVFALEQEGLVTDLIDRSTLIHIQLNPDPRNQQYRRYRAHAFEIDSKTSDCHIVCLNWAQSIEVRTETGDIEKWKNISGSTWYCSADGCSCNDEIISPNHEKGLYYTHMEEKRHALVFNYDEAVFELQVPKIVTVGMGVMANRNGPSATHHYVWSGQDQTWQESETAVDSGFAAMLAEVPGAEEALRGVIEHTNALGVERVLALTAGKAKATQKWFAAPEIDSCQIGRDEVVRRITVSQDQHESAAEFRHNRLITIKNLKYELSVDRNWPPQVTGIDPNAKVHWNPAAPYFNVVTHDQKPSLVIFLGDSPRNKVLENTTNSMYELLRKFGGAAQKRLCVAYRENNELKFAKIPELTLFDDAMEDGTNFTAVRPMDETGN